MKGFRRINGINWLNDTVKVNVTDAGLTTMNYKTTSKLPIHWKSVKTILLLKRNQQLHSRQRNKQYINKRTKALKFKRNRTLFLWAALF